MKCGAAVIVGNRTSLPEVVGDAALAVDPFDVDAIAGAIRKLVNDTSLRRELSVKGLQRANEFNWRETATKTLAVYKEVASV
jgi:glycosyltransferase involved in cell wall biosynthesis